MEDNLNLKDNGSQPPFLGKWKRTSISRWMEDDLNFKVDGRQSQSFLVKWEMTSIFEKLGDNLIFMAKWKTT
jgi:hypothetical protein